MRVGSSGTFKLQIMRAMPFKSIPYVYASTKGTIHLGVTMKYTVYTSFSELTGKAKPVLEAFSKAPLSLTTSLVPAAGILMRLFW